MRVEVQGLARGRSQSTWQRRGQDAALMSTVRREAAYVPSAGVLPLDLSFGLANLALCRVGGGLTTPRRLAAVLPGPKMNAAQRDWPRRPCPAVMRAPSVGLSGGQDVPRYARDEASLQNDDQSWELFDA